LPDAVKHNQDATAETIENNVRRLIIDEMPTNPKYYQRMSELLDELVKQRKRSDIEYKAYLAKLVEFSKQVNNPEQSKYYPQNINSRGKQALYDNLGKDTNKAMEVHDAIMDSRQDAWRGNPLKERAIKIGIKKSVNGISTEEIDDILEIIKNQNEY
jgi:hypothetical protein